MFKAASVVRVQVPYWTFGVSDENVRDSDLKVVYLPWVAFVIAGASGSRIIYR